MVGGGLGEYPARPSHLDRGKGARTALGVSLFDRPARFGEQWGRLGGAAPEAGGGNPARTGPYGEVGPGT